MACQTKPSYYSGSHRMRVPPPLALMLPAVGSAGSGVQEGMDGIQRQKQGKPSARRRWRGTGEEGEEGDEGEEEEKKWGAGEGGEGEEGDAWGGAGRQGRRGRRGEERPLHLFIMMPVVVRVSCAGSRLYFMF